MAEKFKKGDQVIVTTGKSKGHQGPIEKVLSDGYLIVTGANMRKKCVKADPQNNKPGEIKTVEGKIHRSNVAHYNAAKKTHFKVGIKVVDGKRVRVNKSTGDQL